MATDVSNTTLAILLVLTILVSVGGTWTVLDTARQPRQPVIVYRNNQSGMGLIELRIVGEQPANTSTTPTSSVATSINTPVAINKPSIPPKK